jgi:LCP family protein required for cell wall assembly
MSTVPDEPHRTARYYRIRQRRRTWVPVVVWALWALIGVATAVYVGGYIKLNDTLESFAPNTADAKAARAATVPVLPGQPKNILLIGTDTRPGEGDRGRSDTLILVRLDQKQNFISMLSFPRDLWVNIPGYGYSKINEAYSHSTKTVIDTVSELTGQPINYYMIVGFQGFSKLVDVEHGVWIDVDRRYYNKNIGTAATNFSNIDIQPGYQRLNGTDALAYVRYRHTDSTYYRDARQQLFLSELKRQTKDLSNLRDLPSLLSALKGNIVTDLTSTKTFVSVLQFALETPDDRIARASVQGTDGMTSAGASIQEATPAAIAQAVSQWMNPEFEQTSSSSKKPIDPSKIDVMVLNGSGRVLAAEDVASKLAARRWRASVGGNAHSFENPVSAVYYAPGFQAAARKVQVLMGPTATLGSLTKKEARGNQVVVVTGQDWTGKLSKPPASAVTRPPAETVDTTSLVAPIRATRSLVPGTKVMVPMKVATGSSVRIVRTYRVGDEQTGPTALKIVLAVYEGGAPKYWGIEETALKNPPILSGQTGIIDSGGRRYYTYYDGRNLQRIAFRQGGTTYWISNTLQNDLSAKTLEEIAKSMRPLNQARLKKGRTDTSISVETAGTTP